MSDQIKHECGIALIRLLKPLQFYREKYGTALYGINKLYLLMEKQHNRGQDGAGVATIKFDTLPGTAYINRQRSNSGNAIKEIFYRINAPFLNAFRNNPEKAADADWLKNNIDFAGELLLGHLRYGTYGGNTIEHCHPFLRQNNWKTRNLVVAGNFNLTNVDELFDQLVALGQHPREETDTVTVMEKIGHFLDEENERLFSRFKSEGNDKKTISELIAGTIDIVKILQDASKKWDGGYTMAGMFGHGDAFVLRDPNGIRPAFYYVDEEVAVVTSERPVIQTAFDIPIEKIKELTPGHALIIKKNGHVGEYEIVKPGVKKACSFERIYFSRGSDASIYQERKSLGRALTDPVLKAVDYDLQNSVFSYIPNTAEVAFIGLVDGLHNYLNDLKIEKIKTSGGKLNDLQLRTILSEKPRVEKIPIKDAKLRTFITEDNARDEMVAHVYDTTYGVVKYGTDNLVVLDDSIVRGTTLKQSILGILDRLGPKKIVIVSSSPQIRFPDCYGINMSRMTEFIAFEAAISLLKENFRENFIDDLYERAKAQEDLPKENIVNLVKEIYAPFTYEQVSARIAHLLRPVGLKAELEIIFQPIEGLHLSCPDHSGDWYFTGDYPTPGGNKVVNRSFINFMEGKNVRAY
jgi:amidophosphoribosyltransferase